MSVSHIAPASAAGASRLGRISTLEAEIASKLAICQSGTCKDVVRKAMSEVSGLNGALASLKSQDQSDASAAVAAASTPAEANRRYIERGASPAPENAGNGGGRRLSKVSAGVLDALISLASPGVAQTK